MAAVTINDVRFSYLNVFQAKAPFNNPNGEAKFSVTILVPKSNTQAKAIIDQAIAAAIDAGVSTKWNNVRPPQPAICVHDGDGVRPSDGQAFGEDAQLSPRNLVDARRFKVCTPDVTIQVNPERSDLVETRLIGGVRYILIRAEEGVEVNGVDIQIR